LQCTWEFTAGYATALLLPILLQSETGLQSLMRTHKYQGHLMPYTADEILIRYLALEKI
jgi:hypothetical protein